MTRPVLYKKNSDPFLSLLHRHGGRSSIFNVCHLIIDLLPGKSVRPIPLCQGCWAVFQHGRLSLSWAPPSWILNSVPDWSKICGCHLWYVNYAICPADWSRAIFNEMHCALVGYGPLWANENRKMYTCLEMITVLKKLRPAQTWAASVCLNLNSNLNVYWRETPKRDICVQGHGQSV